MPVPVSALVPARGFGMVLVPPLPVLALFLGTKTPILHVGTVRIEKPVVVVSDLGP